MENPFIDEALGRNIIIRDDTERPGLTKRLTAQVKKFFDNQNESSEFTLIYTFDIRLLFPIEFFDERLTVTHFEKWEKEELEKLYGSKRVIVIQSISGVAVMAEVGPPR